jgi:hypothetical protein
VEDAEVPATLKGGSIVSRQDLSWSDKPFFICVCRDGTLTARARKEKAFNGVALPVYGTDTREQAQRLILLVGKVQYAAHPLLPGQTWYRLPDFTGEIDDLGKVTNLFLEVEKQSAAMKARSAL